MNRHVQQERPNNLHGLVAASAEDTQLPSQQSQSGQPMMQTGPRALHILPNLPGKVVCILPTHSDYEPNSHTHGKVLNSLQEGLQVQQQCSHTIV